MLWSKKSKESQLPDLPVEEPIAEKPVLYSSDSESEGEEYPDRHYLPSFPDSPNQKGFSQSAIKEAVSTEEEMENSMIDSKKFKTVEMEDSESLPRIAVEEDMPMPRPRSISVETLIPSLRESQEISHPSRSRGPAGDIFVKIEKFHTARRSLENIREKVSEMDVLLKKIRETKLREEQELSLWEKDLSTVKARIQSVNENIFEKLE